MADAVRLQKFLSRAGHASRREAERMMAAGRVTVNGVVVSELGTRVVPGRDHVELDGRPVGLSETRWIAFYKPTGVLTTRSDPHGGRTIYDVLDEADRGLRYVGRLDRDAEGLLLLTNDGDTAHAVQHPSGEVEREYLAEVAGAVQRSTLGRLTGGVELEDGLARATRAEVERAGSVTSELRLVLKEGRKREIRRMMSAVGHPVLRLRRVRFGPVLLGGLKPGQSRPLTPDEIRSLALAVRGP